MARTEVEKVLYSMGGTSEEVAKTLKKRKIRGDCGVEFSYRNPVARFIRKALKMPYLALDVTQNSCVIWSWFVDNHGSHKVPKAVSRFLVDFQKGKYPALIRKHYSPKYER